MSYPYDTVGPSGSDGSFGPATQAAVKTFNRRTASRGSKRAASAVVDSVTWNTLTNVDCYDSSYSPQEGDVVFFRWSDTGEFHTGIYLYDDPKDKDRIVTVEGNTGSDSSATSTVKIRSRSKSKSVFGYGKNS